MHTIPLLTVPLAAPAKGFSEKLLSDLLHWEGKAETNGQTTRGNITVTGAIPSYELRLVVPAPKELDLPGVPEEVTDMNIRFKGETFESGLFVPFITRDFSKWGDEGMADEDELSYECSMTMMYNITRCQPHVNNTGFTNVVHSDITAVLSSSSAAGGSGCAKWFVRADATMRMLFAQKRLAVTCDST